MERPPARPEGALIRLARKAAGLTVPEAARSAGISKARWSQVESGRETRNGVEQEVNAKSSTIAHMARAVGLSPERLETEGQRPDAAEVLREILRNEPESPRLTSVPPVAIPHDSDDSESAAEAELVELLRKHPDDRILAMIAVRGGATAETRLKEARGWLGVQEDIQRNGTRG